MRLQFFVLGLRGEFLCPVHRQVELAATVVQLTGAGRRRLAVVEQLAGGRIQRLAQDGGFFVARFEAQIFQRHGKRQELTQRIPAQVVFFDQLLDVFGGGATGTGFVHAAARHQGHDRQHLGAGAKFHDREQVGQVITQDVAGDRDRVQATNDTLQRVTHGAHL